MIYTLTFIISVHILYAYNICFRLRFDLLNQIKTNLRSSVIAECAEF